MGVFQARVCWLGEDLLGRRRATTTRQEQHGDGGRNEVMRRWWAVSPNCCPSDTVHPPSRCIYCEGYSNSRGRQYRLPHAWPGSTSLALVTGYVFSAFGSGIWGARRLL